METCRQLSDKAEPACLSVTVELLVIADTNETQQSSMLTIYLPSWLDVVSSAGILTYFKNPGDKVKQGDITVEVFNPLTDEGNGTTIPVNTVTDEVLFS